MSNRHFAESPPSMAPALAFIAVTLLASSGSAQRFDSWVTAPALSYAAASNMVTDPVNGLPTLITRLPISRTQQWNGSAFVPLSLPVNPAPGPANVVNAMSPFAGGIVFLDAAGATWVRFGTGNWTSLGVLTPSPSPRTHAAATTSVGPDGNAWLFGGNALANGQVLGDFWSFSGTAWTSRPAGPGARRGGAVVQNGFGNLYLIGGQNAAGTALKDVWRWTGTGWSIQPAAPTSRYEHSVVLDVARSQLLVVGGRTTSTVLNDQWTVTINADGSLGGWTSLGNLLPTLSSGCTGATDATRQEMVIASGTAVVNDRIASALTVASSPAPCIAPNLQIIPNGTAPRVGQTAFNIGAAVGQANVTITLFGNIGTPAMGAQLATPIPGGTCYNFLPPTAFAFPPVTTAPSGSFLVVGAVPASSILVGLAFDLQAFGQGTVNPNPIATSLLRIVMGR